MDKLFYISDLIARKNKGFLSEEEEIALKKWIGESDENNAIFKRATEDQLLIEQLEVYQLFNRNKVKSALDDQLFKTKVIAFNTKTFMRFAAILIPVILLAGAAWFFLNNSAETNLAELDKTIKPGTQKATLVLSDGNEVDLEDNNLKTEFEQGKTKVTNDQKVLVYSTDSVGGEKEFQPLVYNELITPIGGGYELTLADGSEVILNAGSSIKYPVAFTDSTRKVFLTGEAFFKVNHNGKPFIVECDNMDLRVLGTSFNVSAYSDGPEIKTTLVEGSVKVTSMPVGALSVSKILVPNDQSILEKGEGKIDITQVNTAQYTSWIDGKLEFNQANLEEVMKRLARWYDFKYEFKNQAAKDFHFTARINNDQNISSILKMLEMTTEVKFELDNQTIIIQ